MEDEQLAAVPDGQQPVQGMPPEMPPPPNIHQAVPEVGRARGYVRLAVMDGKTITHDVCKYYVYYCSIVLKLYSLEMCL